MNSAFVIIDIQNDYFENGRNPLSHPDAAARNAEKALKYCRSKGIPVYHVQHVSVREGAAFFLPGTGGTEIHRSVAPQPEEKVFIKHYPSAFLKTGLAEELRGKEIGHLIICGMMSHMCIDTSVRAAQDYGFQSTVLEDACTTMDLAWEGTILPADTVHKTIMASLSGTFARVIKTDQFLAELA